MLKSSSFFLLILLIASSISLQFSNIKHSIQISSIPQYTQYIKTLLSQFSLQDLQQNDKLKQIVSQERISIFNVPQEIVLLLVDLKQQNHKENENNILLLNNVKQNINKFNIINMALQKQPEITNKIKELQSVGKIVHVLETTKQLANKLTIKQNRKLQQTSVNQNHKNQINDSTYILKFFFSLMFIIVSLAALSTIANMENKKDTLLYAKFIADVGTR